MKNTSKQYETSRNDIQLTSYKYWVNSNVYNLKVIKICDEPFAVPFSI